MVCSPGARPLGTLILPVAGSTVAPVPPSFTIDTSTLFLLAGFPPIVALSNTSTEPPVLGTRLVVGLSTIGLVPTVTVAVACLQDLAAPGALSHTVYFIV